MHVKMRNRVAVNLIVQLYTVRDLSQSGGNSAKIPHQGFGFVGAKLVQLHCMPFQYDAAVPTHSCVWTASQVRNAETNQHVVGSPTANRAFRAATQTLPF